MIWKREIICSGRKKLVICFGLDGHQVTYSDPEGLQAISLDQEDPQILQRKLRDTCSDLAELHPTYFDPEKPLVTCLRRAPSYLFRSRRSPDFAKKAQGYLFRSRRAPSYLFRSRKAPSYLFRSKKAPSYLFRSKKSDGRQSRSYFFRSRKAPGYLFRSRRSKGYLFRSRREEQTDNSVKNDNDQSIATRAGYLFRTRKSFPSEMTDAQEQPKVELTGSPLTRHLRSKSYLFRS